MNKKWEEVKLKHLYNLTNGGTPKSDEPTYWEPKEIEWITPEDLSTSGKKVNTVKRKISKRGLANSSATLIKENSVVISTRAPIGNPKLVPFQYSTNQGCKSMSPKHKNNSSPEYLYYFLLANEEKLKNLGRGTTFLELSNFALRNFKILNPSIKEQNYIVKFLDVKTSEIDTLISDKEELITLLEEKRQAVITEAVTKGLDPDVKMKDSGVEWIGEIPEHWESKRMKYLIFLNPPKSECLLSEDATVTFAPMEKVLRSGVLDRSLSCSIKEVYSGYTYFRNGDIIMAKVTPCFENGNIALAQELTNSVGFGTTELHVIRAKKHILNEYLYYLLRSDTFRQNGIPEMYGVAGLKRLPSNYIENYKVPLPSISEQRKIVKKLKENISLINIVLENINVQLCKLKEYRESLIYEAVTGKIDAQEMIKETEQEEVSSS